MVFNWSVVHGFAMLLIDARLDGVLGSGESCWDSETLLDAALDAAFA